MLLYKKLLLMTFGTALVYTLPYTLKDNFCRQTSYNMLILVSRFYYN